MLCQPADVCRRRGVGGSHEPLAASSLARRVPQSMRKTRPVILSKISAGLKVKGSAEYCVSIRESLVPRRGVGGSHKPAPPEEYSTDAMAGDTLGLMDHLAWPTAHVVGMSMGGAHARMLTGVEGLRVFVLEPCHSSSSWCLVQDLGLGSQA